jgi:hypothetical protein
MAITGSCVSTMEKPYFRITTSPESPTCLYILNTHKGQTGRLASLASHRCGQYPISSGMDNIIAALEQSNRVCRVSLVHLRRSQVQEVLAAMQVPFPELTYLQLSSDDETSPAPLVIPDSFLGGFAPHLRHFFLDGIQFPESPTVLLSATTHLVTLWLAQYSSFWVHFTRDGRSPLHVVQPRNTFP